MTQLGEISEAQNSRLISAQALTAAQLQMAKALVASSYNWVPDHIAISLVGQITVALATNYAAEMARTT